MSDATHARHVTKPGEDGLLSSYTFELPPERIAQTPPPDRDASRLMVLDPAGGVVAEGHFRDLPCFLSAGDLLVRNNVRVFPARLRGRSAGGGEVEVLLVRPGEYEGAEAWLALARPASRFKPGRTFAFGENGELTATARGRGAAGEVWLTFAVTGPAFMAALARYGTVPLPPYITRPGGRPTADDAERYQTLYATRPGAVAAPTAGLHFTAELDKRLADAGISIAEVTLNVGPGTFRPVKTESLDEHHMDAEWYECPAETWQRIQTTRERGGRVVAVGTTTARALESAAGSGELSGWTRLFIRPGHRFQALDGLVTNFHLPGSTLIVLVSALAGRARVLAAYERAVAGDWRFYSYGDAMLVWAAADATAESLEEPC